MRETGAAVWRRSTRCEGGHCVEVADLGNAVGLRNSTLPEVELSFSVDQWRDFVTAVRAGEFDRA